jgi:outer membrane receptor protein involved in Fe transport
LALALVCADVHAAQGPGVEDAGAGTGTALAAPDGAPGRVLGVQSGRTTTAAEDLALPEYTVVGKSALIWNTNRSLDDDRDQLLLPKFGTTAYNINEDALKALPQGDNTPLDKVLLQAPGVSYDSAISNPDFHVRNEYANVQYRVNGIQLPDGVSALGPVLETGFVGNLNLLDGALPAQYGLRTAGVVDITSKTEFEPGGNLDVYGGTWDTFSPSIEVGGHAGQTQYFITGRYLQSSQGLENAMPTANPIHDATTQEKFFGYASTLLGDNARLTYMGGAFNGQFQIPDVAGQKPLGDYGSLTVSSAGLDDHETDQFFFGVIALQTHGEKIDAQGSIFSRYATVEFVPDVYGDLAFNDVASNVSRESLLSGVQFDVADRLLPSNTLRIGFDASAESTQTDDRSTVLPLSGGIPVPDPETLDDATTKLGWNEGAYIQDEWRVIPEVTLNTGLRFDQMDQFVSANQVSPRIALVYKPGPGTVIHAGVSRYFTPPMQAQSTPNNLALFENTTQQPAILLDDPIEPERATYYDVGLEQTCGADLSGGLDTYYKDSTDTLDDGQFGQAVVLDQFNYARGYSEGAEFKLDYAGKGLRAYVNLSYEVTMVEDVVSNQYIIGDPVELDYFVHHYTRSSDAQAVSSSFGTSYRWRNWLGSLDGIYGSGLAAGFANEQNLPGYTQWNAAIACSFDPWRDRKQLKFRLSANNLFDAIYLVRGATGVGEFAPQYGPRRSLYAEVTQQF